jgi:hypothetical protein
VYFSYMFYNMSIIISDAPEEINGWFGFHRVPTGSPLPEELHGEHGVVTTWCYTGPVEEAEEGVQTHS